MTIDASALLRMLGAGPRTTAIGQALAQGTSRPGAAAPTGVEAGQFADLLAKARAGELSSNQPVTISPGAASSLRLTDDQLARISIAADNAESQGLHTALVLIDDQRLVLDVENRTLAPLAGDVASIAEVDGVINLTTQPADQAAAVPPPAATTSSASLARILAERAAAHAA